MDRKYINRASSQQLAFFCFIDFGTTTSTNASYWHAVSVRVSLCNDIDCTEPVESCMKTGSVDRKRLLLTVALLVAVGLLVLLTRNFFFVKVKPMSVHDRVTTVIQTWARLTSPPSDKQELEVIWATSGRQFEFYPYAAQDLTTSLNNEFRDSKKPVLQFTDIYANTNSGGRIKTVNDLATAVRQNYRPQ